MELKSYYKTVKLGISDGFFKLTRFPGGQIIKCLRLHTIIYVFS